MRVATFSLTAVVLVPSLARAATGAWADPPPASRPIVVAREHASADGAPPSSTDFVDSPFRLSVGTAARFDANAIRGGLTAAIDIGRGPAGFRLSGTWIQVGYADPLSQYTGELTLSFPLRGRLVPVIGTGGGVARTYRVGALGERKSGGSMLGVGVLRAAIEYRIPLSDVDARLGIGATGTVPAIRAGDAPDLGAWVVGMATVGVGF